MENVKKMMLYLAFDSECKKIFSEHDIEKILIEAGEGKDLIVGKLNPINIPNDPSVEEKQIRITYSAFEKCYIIQDVSSAFGSYFKIIKGAPFTVNIKQYVIIGESWLLWNYEKGDCIFTIINKNYEVVKMYKIEPDIEYTVGRKPSNNIVIEKDLTASGVHLKFIVHENSISITDMNSTNGTFVKIEGEIKKKESDFDAMILRIGLETFCKIEYGVPVQINQNLEDFNPVNIYEMIPPRVPINVKA